MPHRTEILRTSSQGRLAPCPLSAPLTTDYDVVSTLIDRQSTCVGEAVALSAYGGVHSGAHTCECAGGFKDSGTSPTWRGATCDATGCSEVRADTTYNKYCIGCM